MKKNKMAKVIKIIIAIFFTTLKAFWEATIHIVWGIASIFLLVGLISYFKVDASPILTLLKIAHYIMKEWAFFWWIFFVYEIFSNLKGEKII